MQVLLPIDKELDGFERELQMVLEQANLAGYALMGFKFRESSSSVLHEIDALVILEPGIFVCLEAKNYRGKWTGSINEKWFCNDHEINAVGANPYEQVQKYCFVIRERLKRLFVEETKFFVNSFTVVPDQADIEIKSAVVDQFQPGGRTISICHLSSIVKVLGKIRAGDEVAKKVRTIGIENIVSELIDIPVERLQNHRQIILEPEKKSISSDLKEQNKTEEPNKVIDSKDKASKEQEKENSKPNSGNQNPIAHGVASQKPKLKKWAIGLGLGATLAVLYMAAQTVQFLVKPKINAESITIGSLGSPKEQADLEEYLSKELISANYFNFIQGKKPKILVDGDKTITYQEGRNRMAAKEWDIAFTLSPVNSIFAKDNGYTFAAAMFPKSKNYQSGLFVRADSPIRSLADIKPTTTVALGGVNSASSFYMPVFDLYGKRLTVDMGNRGPKIIEMVKTGQVEVGAAAIGDSIRADDTELRILQISRDIPSAGVYLSPTLTASDQEVIRGTLLRAPQEIQDKTNYGAGKEPDYTEFRKIIDRTESVLLCSDLTQNPVNLFCPSDFKSTSIAGKINGMVTNPNDLVLNVISSNQNYRISVSNSILKEVTENIAFKDLQGKLIEVKLPSESIQNKGGYFTANVTQPSQITLN
jgi:ABC-type phosphate/phosphonate transport system substrate-binding protein